MTILLTGAGGFVGSAVLGELGGRGRAVVVASRGTVPDARRLPGPDEPAEAFTRLLDGVEHVIHCAGLTNADPRTGEAGYMAANARLVERLATAAARVTGGRFVLVSSASAAIGSGYAGAFDETTPAAPDTAYGRSKRAGEVAALAAFSEAPGRLAILRPVPVHGEGMRGGLAALLKLARLPLPLPFASMTNRRSLVSVRALAGAAALAATSPQMPGGVFVVADRRPATLPQIVAAFRRGLDRPPGLLPSPPALLGGVARLAGAGPAWERISADQHCEPARLEAAGWTPEPDSLAALAELARRAAQAGGTD